MKVADFRNGSKADVDRPLPSSALNSTADITHGGFSRPLPPRHVCLLDQAEKCRWHDPPKSPRTTRLILNYGAGSALSQSWRDRKSRVTEPCHAGAIETSISQEIDATKVSVPKHLGHSKVRKSKPGLSGSMIRNAIISPHVEQRGLSITSMNTAYSPIGNAPWTRFVQILCSEGD